MTAPSFGQVLFDVMAANAQAPFTDLEKALTSSVRQWADDQSPFDPLLVAQLGAAS